MGYSEVPCYLCGVSFNIARLRTLHEPPEAAWKSAAWNASEGTFVEHDHMGWDPCESDRDGCRVALRTERRIEGTLEPALVVSEFSEGYDEDADGTYEYESEADDEPLEYVFNDNHEPDEDVEMSGLSEEGSEGEGSPFCEDYLTLLRTADQREVQTPAQETFHEIEQSKDFLTSLWQREKKNHVHDTYEDNLTGIEHIAGPSCKCQNGYNGHSISTDEMKGCCTYQMLAYKPANWKPESDDQDFELEGECFLTGIGDRFPSTEASPNVYPARHGWDEGQTWYHTPTGTERDVAMPFHPTCFHIFTRLSHLHLGKLDIHGLMSWRDLRLTKREHENHSRDENVQRAREQPWSHFAGDEYLAANPVYIPGLASILRSSVSTDPNFSSSNGAFDIPLPDADSESKDQGNQDQLLKLPQELRLQIIDYLDSPDIASLRLASPAFRQLPLSLFYTLLRRTLPSLWEISSTAQTHTPMIWTALEVLSLKREIRATKEYEDDFQIRKFKLWEEMPEVMEQWSVDQPAYAGVDAWGEAREFIDRVKGEHLSGEERGRVNWYVLITALNREMRMGGLKGLRNRERIWRDVEGIVEEIVRLRSDGAIVD